MLDHMLIGQEITVGRDYHSRTAAAGPIAGVALAAHVHTDHGRADEVDGADYAARIRVEGLPIRVRTVRCAWRAEGALFGRPANRKEVERRMSDTGWHDRNNMGPAH
jgi:hypothetical protein